MQNKQQRMELYKGDDLPLSLNMTLNFDTVLDITGYKFYFTLKDSKADPDNEALISLEWTTHSAPTQGKTEFVIPSSSTVNLKPGQYYWDIQFKTPSGSVRTVVDGIAELIEQVTRRSS